METLSELLPTGAANGEAFDTIVGTDRYLVQPAFATDGTLAALLSTGMDRWEALGYLAPAFEFVADWGSWAARHCGGCDASLAAADRISAVFPALADHLLREGLRGQKLDDDLDLSGREWITGLPEGLRVTGYLALVGCRSILELPEGLHVGGNLNLLDCAGLVRLPKGLVVGKDVFLDGCAAWDGILPPDVKIGRSLYCEGRPGNYHRPGDLLLITRR